MDAGDGDGDGDIFAVLGTLAMIWGNRSAQRVRHSASSIRRPGVADVKVTGEEVVAAQS